MQTFHKKYILKNNNLKKDKDVFRIILNRYVKERIKIRYIIWLYHTYIILY